MIKISNFVLVSFIFLVVFLSQLGMHSGVKPIFAGSGVFFFIFLNIFFLMKYQKIIKIPYTPKIYYVLFCGLIIFSVISYINTGRIKVIIVYGSLISLFFAARILSIYIRNKEQFILNLVLGTSLMGTIIVLLGMDTSFSFYRYEGFYTNANSMGMFAANLLHMLIGTLYAYDKIDYGKKKKLFFYVSMFLFTILILASNSRAAILSVFLIILLIPLIEIYKSFKLKYLRIKTLYLKRFIFYFLLIGITLSSIYFFGLFENTFEKFITKTKAGDVSDGRLESWIIMIKNWSWFGHDNTYFEFQKLISKPYKSIIWGHNTWLSHLNYYGLLNALCFVSWIFYMILWSWNNIKIDNSDRPSTIFIFIIIGYVFNATFETATSTPGLFVSIFIFGILYTKRATSKNLNEEKI